MLETEQQAVNCEGYNLQCNFVTMTSKINDFSKHVIQTVLGSPWTFIKDITTLIY